MLYQHIVCCLWYLYEYILYSVQNNPNGGIVENKIFSGKPEAVMGYLKGFNDAIYLFSNNNSVFPSNTKRTVYELLFIFILYRSFSK